MKLDRTIYYSNENEEVIKFKEKNITINKDYTYIHKNFFYKLWSWLTYKVFATPIAFIVFKIFKRVKFHNKKILKKWNSGGYFIYANHTNHLCDGFCPALICFPKKPHIIVNPVNVSMPFIGKLTKMWGALPIPNSIEASKNFFSAIDATLKNNNPVLIYPEAHLWPYHTKIRNFDSTSFRFPVKFNKPVFTFTTVYRKRKHKKHPRVEIYVDGPFFVNTHLPVKTSQEALRDVVFNKMQERAKLNNCEFIQYKKRS